MQHKTLAQGPLKVSMCQLTVPGFEKLECPFSFSQQKIHGDFGSLKILQPVVLFLRRVDILSCLSIPQILPSRNRSVLTKFSQLQ